MISPVTQDRRIRRTQHLLAQALITLTLENGYEAVTIRDITEQADIGYATFFRHYKDKDDLLEDVLDVVLDELQQLLATTQPDADPAAVGTLVFRYVQAHSEVVRVLLGCRAALQRLITVVTRQIVDDHADSLAAALPRDLAAHHIVSATIALIAWWLDHAMPYPPEQMGRIYHELIARPTDALGSSDSDYITANVGSLTAFGGSTFYKV
jgi:AcrR family transcriptional regulator